MIISSKLHIVNLGKYPMSSIIPNTSSKTQIKMAITSAKGDRKSRPKTSGEKYS